MQTDTTAEESLTLPNEGEMPDLLEEANMFEWAGIGIGREETYLLMLAMKQLLETNPLKSVRFFGKIFGRFGDYFIVESEVKDGHSIPVPATQTESKEDSSDEEDAQSEEKKQPVIPPEEEGHGTNRYVYWCCSSRKL